MILKTIGILVVSTSLVLSSFGVAHLFERSPSIFHIKLVTAFKASNDKTLPQFEYVQKHALKGDTVYVYVNSPGGSVGTLIKMVKIVKELQDRGVRVIGEVGEYAASAGAYILCYFDSVVIDDNDRIMFHYHSYKGGETLTRQSENLRDIDYKFFNWADATMRQCHGILTEGHIFLVQQGLDVWIVGKELRQTTR